MKRNGEWITEGVVFTASILAAWISRAWWIVLPTGILYMGNPCGGRIQAQKEKPGNLCADRPRSAGRLYNGI